MIITFFGHSDFVSTPEVKGRLSEIIEESAKAGELTLYFGGYGNFDEFTFSVANSLKQKTRARHIFVTPYITESYEKNHLSYIKESYDEILYPPLESVPYRFAISARNKWLVENSDLIVFFVRRRFGGAYKAYLHAKKKGKQILNLCNFGKTE